MVRFRSLAVSISRVVAVGFALTALAWFVVRADQNARATSNLRSASARSADVHPLDGGSADEGGPVAIDPRPAPRRPVFMGTTKSEPLAETEVLDVFTPAGMDAPQQKESAKQDSPVFLYSSKSLLLPTRILPPLQPGSFSYPKAPTDPAQERP